MAARPPTPLAAPAPPLGPAPLDRARRNKEAEAAEDPGRRAIPTITVRQDRTRHVLVVRLAVTGLASAAT